MNRKSVVIAIISLCAVLAASAKMKEYPRAQIKVGYTYHETFVRGEDGIIERDVPFILLANQERSKFYCPQTEYKDSLESTPSGRALSTQMLHAAIEKYIASEDRSAMDAMVYHSFLYVFKSVADNEMTVYDKAGLFDYGYYSEPIKGITWEIGDSVNTVLGYECTVATAEYHGRKWTAWFSPEIPISDGPWKLTGLPGLILKATESTGQHYFTANGIEQSDKEMRPIYNSDKYDKMGRIDMLKAHRDRLDHSASVSTAATGINFGSDHIRTGDEVNIDFIETDYHE